ncbi:MAG TPA: adenylate/guanylate cyclase domain-containing protein [Chroococcidiopsis sp.]
MVEANYTDRRDDPLWAEVMRLRHEVEELRRANSDLQIALMTTAEHGDMIEAELHRSNQQLQTEISERKMAQATLQTILETVSRDKADLELMLKATAEHGDMLEYQLYTQAVETMRQNEELFRAISESTPVLMILTQHEDGAIAYANSVSGERLGIDAQSLIGQKLNGFFVNPEDEQTLQDLLKREGKVRSYEVQIRSADQSVLWVSASIHPLQLVGESIMLTTLYDISDRKRAEEALRRSEEQLRLQAQELEQRVEERTSKLKDAEAKYRSIFENAAGGIFQVTPSGRYITVNPTLAEIYGYDSPQELMTTVTNIGQQLYVKSRRRDELTGYLNQFDTVTDFESQVYRKDGSVIWVSENIRVIRDQDGAILRYEGSVQDITDRKSTEEELRQQRRVSERLLLNVLPQPIAERLKRGEKTIADSFTEVTVLFADISGFTALSSQSSPIELVELLNQVFSTFDKLADRHGLEKIKTIGDAYMVVGGLPTPKADHVQAIAKMSLDMQEAIARFTSNDGLPITIRVGIHTGPVVAGVIGTKKFIYDLWGDTVNVASRMETQGEPKRIQVTEAVYQRLQHQFIFEQRGVIDVKGKGEMLTYWLVGQQPVDPDYEELSHPSITRITRPELWPE